MTVTNGNSNGEKVVLTTESEFSLSVNGLQDLATFEHTPAGLCLVSKVSLPAGAHFTYLTSHVPQPRPTWRTIQTSKTTHTDPRSALLYMNHSCAPSIEVHIYSPDKDGKYPTTPPNGASLNGESGHPLEYGLAGEIKVSRDRGVEPGEPLTFFYPSTEWKFDRSFDCLCGAGKGVCVGNVQGASAIDYKSLDRWFINEHIWQMARERDGKN
ncbi:hypothetical protein TI39_contig385g00030 [Zymoseptoria brevis]|uniref:SET domain-containing protein n=1 Tax=Zymoseptoria brevis TaxID=1047168 RepID=A0A0F4GP55_9PEZI|nr:hypothetical protein TI39_contig385g00030 [Zymoseptoria brevis]